MFLKSVTYKHEDGKGDVDGLDLCCISATAAPILLQTTMSVTLLESKMVQGGCSRLRERTDPFELSLLQDDT